MSNLVEYTTKFPRFYNDVITENADFSRLWRHVTNFLYHWKVNMLNYKCTKFHRHSILLPKVRVRVNIPLPGWYIPQYIPGEIGLNWYNSPWTLIENLNKADTSKKVMEIENKNKSKRMFLTHFKEIHIWWRDDCTLYFFKREVCKLRAAVK